MAIALSIPENCTFCKLDTCHPAQKRELGSVFLQDLRARFLRGDKVIE